MNDRAVVARFVIPVIAFCGAVGLCTNLAVAQRVQFPTPVNATTVYQPAVGPLAQAQTVPRMQPPVTLGQPQPFDPYATSQGSILPPPAVGGTSPITTQPIPSQPLPGQPPAAYTQPGLAPGTAPGAFPSGPPVVYPQTPSYPQAVPPPYQPTGGPPWQVPWSNPYGAPYLRLINRVGGRYTWIYGDHGNGPTSLSENTAEAFVTLNFPNFLFSPQPLSVTPGIAFHWWDGPADTASEIPARTYTAYVDFAWNPQLTERFGAELHFTPRLGTDFNHVQDDSFRFAGSGLAVVGLTPTIKAKFGIEYINRVDIKLLPAGGFLWEPNPQTRFDIYFPRPKLAKYFYSVGNVEVWWYVGGEYGGGTWTAQFSTIGPADEDVFDVNDIRVFGGLEWMHMNRLTGFFEVGYVFEREVVYQINSGLNFKPDDSIMLRGGVLF